MSDAQTSDGAKLYIGAAAPATYDKAGYEAVTWQEVGIITDIPEISESANEVTFSPLSAEYVEKLKGIRTGNTLTLMYGYDTDDAGQVDMDESYAGRTPSPIKVVTQGTEHLYFMAQVMSKSVTISTVDNVVMKSNSVSITGPKGVLETTAPI